MDDIHAQQIVEEWLQKHPDYEWKGEWRAKEDGAISLIDVYLKVFINIVTNFNIVFSLEHRSKVSWTSLRRTIYNEDS